VDAEEWREPTLEEGMEASGKAQGRALSFRCDMLQKKVSNMLLNGLVLKAISVISKSLIFAIFKHSTKQCMENTTMAINYY